MKIGNISFNGICLAPMEEVSDLAFRLTCKHYGAGMVYTEMCHSKTLLHGNLDRAQISEEEKPIGIQIAGSTPEEVIEAAKILESQADIIDINLGCPGKNVISCGAGSALLKQPAKIGDIISGLVHSVKIPVTAKMRAGFTSDADAVLIAKIIEKAEGSAVTVHPRTQEQGYSGRAKWDIIKAVKQAVSIPVIGNGDIRSGADALAMIKTTGCDGIMIGRAAIGDPLIFKRVSEYLSCEGREPEIESTIEERIKALELYAHYAKRFDLFMKTRMLRQSQHVTRFLTGAAEFRMTLSQIKDPEDILQKTIVFLQYHSCSRQVQ